jgi:tetratricopeptide (TPR) repeat protein
MARSAHREAVEFLEQALSALPHLPETRKRQEQAIDLLLDLRSALQPSGDFGRILASLREAEAMAVALNDHHRLGLVLGLLSNYFHRMGTADQAVATAQRALALATAGKEVVLQALANAHLGGVYQAQGEYRRAIDCFEQTMASLTGEQRHERFGQIYLPVVRCRANLASCHAELGTFAEGIALGGEGLRIAEAVAHPASRMIASWGIGLLALRQGDLPRAIPPLEWAVGICQEVDNSTQFPEMAAALGAAYTLGGRITEAVSLLMQALAQATAIETVFMQVLCRLSLGEAQLLAGRLEEAHVLAERALALAREHQEQGHQAYALRLLGEIAVRRERPGGDSAEAHYCQALTLAEELGMRPLVAHCHLSLGKLCAKIGRCAEARSELSTAIEMYRAMEMSFWLPQAEAALAQVT